MLVRIRIGKIRSSQYLHSSKYIPAHRLISLTLCRYFFADLILYMVLATGIWIFV